MKALLENYLEREPEARERRNKSRAIGNLLIEEHNLNVPKDVMARVVDGALAADRYWRKILEERPDLRGSDYDDREKLAQEKQVELGYEPGFIQDTKLVV